MKTLYAATAFNITESIIEDLKNGIDRYFMSLKSAFSSAKYFIAKQDAMEYENELYKINDHDCKAVFTVEVEQECHGNASIFFVKKILTVEFPKFNKAIIINSCLDKILSDANSVRDPNYQTLFNLNGFACTQKNFCGDYLSLVMPVKTSESLSFFASKKELQNTTPHIFIQEGVDEKLQQKI